MKHEIVARKFVRLDALERRTERRERSIHAASVIEARFHPHSEVGGRAGLTMVADGERSDDEVLSSRVVEGEQQIGEV